MIGARQNPTEISRWFAALPETQRSRKGTWPG